MTSEEQKRIDKLKFYTSLCDNVYIEDMKFLLNIIDQLQKDNKRLKDWAESEAHENSLTLAERLHKP